MDWLAVSVHGHVGFGQDHCIHSEVRGCVERCRGLGSVVGWAYLLSFAFKVSYQLGSLVGYGCVRWGHYLDSAIPFSLVRLQAVVPCRVVTLVGFCDWEGLQAVLPIALDCVGPQAE